MEKINSKISIFSKIGNYLGSLCLIHCILFPFLILLTPLVGTFFIPSWVDKTIIILAVWFSFFSLCWGYKIHGRLRAFGFLAAAFMWLWIAHDFHNPFIFSVIGSVCLFVANYTNRKLCNSCQHCHNEK